MHVADDRVADLLMNDLNMSRLQRSTRGLHLPAGRPVQGREGVPEVHERLRQGAVRPHGGAPKAVMQSAAPSGRVSACTLGRTSLFKLLLSIVMNQNHYRG